MAQDDAVKDSVEAYQDALSVSDRQREQIRQDLEFSDPSNPRQWDEDEENQRRRDPGGARPCLTNDLVGQYVANIAGQISSNPPSIHVIPVDGGADVKAAQQLDGVLRSVEYSSRAPQHYSRAVTAAARAGVGYLILRPEVIDRALNYQMPMISSEGDPLRVVLDPWSTELDGADADFGFLLTPLSPKMFERRFGKDAQKVSFGDDDAADERESILVVEEWRTEKKKRSVVVYLDENGNQSSLPEEDFIVAVQGGQQLTPQGTYADEYNCVKWRQMSGAEVLEKEREYPASGIGIIPVYGYTGYADGRLTYCGLPRRARSPQQAYNRAISEIQAFMDQAPKTPWIASARAVKGFERLWERASVEARGFMPYNDIDDSGNTIPAPQRASPTINLNNLTAAAENARNDIQACTGIYAANLGQASNETSGVAIESRKQQGEASTSHFPGNLAASVGRLGRLAIEMISRLVDTPRQLRIMGLDSTPSSVRVDPGQKEALVEGQGRGVSINPNIGQYDVHVVVGASFSTQRTQAQTALTEMMRANPEMTPAIAPLWAQTLDIPNADKLSQVLLAVAPPPVRDILAPGDDKESKEQLHAKLGDAQKALEEATALAKDAQQDADQAHAKLAEMAQEHADKQDELSIKAYEALTKRLQVTSVAMQPEQVQALVNEAVMAALSQPDPMDGSQDIPAEVEQVPQELEQPQEEQIPSDMPPPGEENYTQEALEPPPSEPSPTDPMSASGVL